MAKTQKQNGEKTFPGHRVQRVLPGSIAEELEIEPGDEVLSVDGEPIRDIFDYQFLIQEEYIELALRKAGSGESWLLEIEKEPEEDLGLVFDSPLMDRYQSCHNHCIFCFIDQNPSGMRDTLYFKDDDARLSFLQGNYVTLTNMTEADIDRIIQYRMEPINISFHTTDPDLRIKMLRNKRAGEVLAYVDRLASADLMMNGQIVLCRHINDGEALDKTLSDLLAYWPALQSVSVVPVGLTKYREHLYPLESFDRESAMELLQQVHQWQEKAVRQTGKHVIHASDEWYLLAGEPLPEADRYDGYPQLENGVGRMRLLLEEVREVLAERCGDDRARKLALATGQLAQPVLEQLMHIFSEKYPHVQVLLYPIRNDFFGEQITVSGLVTGQDLIAQLKHCDLGEELLLPCHMLRAGEDVFLDDVSVAEVAGALQIPVRIVDAGGQDLIQCLLGEQTTQKQKRRQAYEQADPGNRRSAECGEVDAV